MGERLICRKCKEGLYSYSEPDKEDWENREMTCDACGHRYTIQMITEEFFTSIGDENLLAIARNSRLTDGVADTRKGAHKG